MSSQTTNLLLTDQDTGSNSNSWGDVLDANFEIIDAKTGDMATVTDTSGTVALSSTQERVNVIKCTATLVGNLTLEFSGRGGTWIVWNATSGAFTVTAKVSGQTGVVVTQGTKKIVFCDGTDVREGVSLTSTLLDIGDLTPTDSNVIVGNGTTWVAKSGATARTSLGLGTGDSPTFTGLTLTGALAANGGGTLGDASGDAVVIKGTTVNANVSGLFDATSVAGLYKELADATQNEGFTILATSDHIVVQDNTDGTWSKFDIQDFIIAALSGSFGAAASVSSGDKILVRRDVSGSSEWTLAELGVGGFTVVT